MHAAHFQWKQLRRLFTQGPRLPDRAGIEINVGVVARYLLHLNPSESCSNPRRFLRVKRYTDAGKQEAQP
ncbi:hypothetical protein D3C78_1820390 [compost metagenome]